MTPFKSSLHVPEVDNNTPRYKDSLEKGMWASGGTVPEVSTESGAVDFM
jgi:hypothetical protein